MSRARTLRIIFRERSSRKRRIAVRDAERCIWAGDDHDSVDSARWDLSDGCGEVLSPRRDPDPLRHVASQRAELGDEARHLRPGEDVVVLRRDRHGVAPAKVLGRRRLRAPPSIVAPSVWNVKKLGAGSSWCDDADPSTNATRGRLRAKSWSARPSLPASGPTSTSTPTSSTRRRASVSAETFVPSLQPRNRRTGWPSIETPLTPLVDRTAGEHAATIEQGEVGTCDRALGTRTPRALDSPTGRRRRSVRPTAPRS